MSHFKKYVFLLAFVGGYVPETHAGFSTWVKGLFKSKKEKVQEKPKWTYKSSFTNIDKDAKQWAELIKKVTSLVGIEDKKLINKMVTKDLWTLNEVLYQLQQLESQPEKSVKQLQVKYYEQPNKWKEAFEKARNQHSDRNAFDKKFKELIWGSAFEDPTDEEANSRPVTGRNRRKADRSKRSSFVNANKNSGIKDVSAGDKTTNDALVKLSELFYSPSEKNNKKFFVRWGKIAFSKLKTLQDIDDAVCDQFNINYREYPYVDTAKKNSCSSALLNEIRRACTEQFKKALVVANDLNWNGSANYLRDRYKIEIEKVLKKTAKPKQAE
ncbi:MAG: hypothetical protein BGO07_00985 [Alphaproteobacteria bacterium 40-19]|nr:MAG: hypothetical protein BGO07_00985 [Alphaproteobacteria bacterium 40-19]